MPSERSPSKLTTYHALDGTAIVMDPWTGEILAMANYARLRSEPLLEVSPTHSARDRAVMDAYEPGSTYKLVTAAAALESDKVTLQTRFPARDAL